ncbi:hypothetical protein ACFY9N_05705 [Microbacterium sp. NPDC008134]|uniref:hypothetical protein n=1 Tax=Microbacterium sp. NPDC008134 TaxID=3364183 RepID=UPI0036E16CC0
MTIDAADEDAWRRLIARMCELPSEISFGDVLRETGPEARSMQNNKPRYLADVTAELVKTVLTKNVIDGRRPDMSIASQVLRGTVSGYDAVTPMNRFQVAHSMIDVVDALVVDELSKLVMPSRNSRLTWKQAAHLVGLPESTLHSRYGDRVYYRKA